jgi:hypothetical protein
MRRIVFVMIGIALFWCCRDASMALAENYQIQLGSTKSMEAARYFTGKASRVLGSETYIVQSGNYYVAVTGSFGTREKASAELMRIAKHYTAYITSYDERNILAAFADGEELPSANYTRPPQDPAASKDGARKDAPIRAVPESETALLDRAIQSSLTDVVLDKCVLTHVARLQEFVFTTTCNLKDLDPFGLKTEERHGKNVYFNIPVLNNQKKVLIEERAENALVSTRAESVLLLRAASEERAAVDKLRTALRERINHCARGK